jgi:hypothetical protein
MKQTLDLQGLLERIKADIENFLSNNPQRAQIEWRYDREANNIEILKKAIDTCEIIYNPDDTDERYHFNKLTFKKQDINFEESFKVMKALYNHLALHHLVLWFNKQNIDLNQTQSDINEKIDKSLHMNDKISLPETDFSFKTIIKQDIQRLNATNNLNDQVKAAFLNAFLNIYNTKQSIFSVAMMIEPTITGLFSSCSTKIQNLIKQEIEATVPSYFNRVNENSDEYKELLIRLLNKVADLKLNANLTLHSNLILIDDIQSKERVKSALKQEIQEIFKVQDPIEVQTRALQAHTSSAQDDSSQAPAKLNVMSRVAQALMGWLRKTFPWIFRSQEKSQDFNNPQI